MSDAFVGIVDDFRTKQRVDGNPYRAESAEDHSLLVAQGVSPYVEFARSGDVWSVITTAAVAAVVVRPSTTSLITLWNGHSVGGKSFVIDRLFAHNLIGTANSVYGLWACIHPAGMAKPTTVIAPAATNYVGNTGKVYNGMAIAKVDMAVNDNGWFPWGRSEHTVTITTPGGILTALVEGRLIVPPQGGISVQVVADVVGATFTCGLSWLEKQLTLV